MRCTRASAILFAVALAGADARAQEPILDHLIPTWSEASLAASPLLPGPEFGAMAAVYCDVPLGTPWAVAIRKRDGDVAVLELRRARYVGETHIGGLEVTSSPVSMGLAIAVSESCQSRPVGVTLDASGMVIDLNEAHDVTVRYIRETDHSSDRLQVALWGFSPMCYLATDHPEFDRLRSTLGESAGTSARLWVANHSQMVEAEPPAEGGEFEVWWKIMDVRPA